jgi:hypothetical protein
MRRVFMLSLTGVLVSSCAGPDVTGPPTDSGGIPVIGNQATVKTPPDPNPAPKDSWLGLLDDALGRLVPALGPAGAALGTPLLQVRKDGPNGSLTAQLVGATKLQLEAIAGSLPAELSPDADALRLTLSALGTLTK